MSTPTLIYFLAIIAIGLPSALRVTGFKVRVRNATALAMVAMWMVSRAVYHATGEWLPVKAMILQDLTVIAAMFLKEDWQECSYPTLRSQFAALWYERTPWDRAILALFPIAWLFYNPITDPFIQFWTLYGISLAQLMLAGREALHQWQRASGHKLRADQTGHKGLMFTARRAGYG